MNTTTYDILQLVIKLIVSLMVAYVIPTAKRYFEDKAITKYVEQAIKSAEQILDHGTDKKVYATNLVKSLCDKAHIQISKEQIEALIEAAVYELHKEV